MEGSLLDFLLVLLHRLLQVSITFFLKLVFMLGELKAPCLQWIPVDRRREPALGGQFVGGRWPLLGPKEEMRQESSVSPRSRGE
jgi:hypothetical protein